MRVLLVFLLAALGCSLTEGRSVTRCELRDELKTTIGRLQEILKQKGLPVDVIVAHVVCHAQFASGFNTSAVNQLDPGSGKHNGKGKRDTSYGGLFSIAELDAVTTPPPARGRRHAGKAPPTTPKPPHVGDNIWTLYGLFQLSNHLVCSDGESPSPNICGLSCSQLIDDDINDDISCVFTIFQYLLDKGFGYEHRRELMMMVRLIYQQECRTITASEYFTDCPSQSSS